MPNFIFSYTMQKKIKEKISNNYGEIPINSIADMGAKHQRDSAKLKINSMKNALKFKKIKYNFF